MADVNFRKLIAPLLSGQETLVIEEWKEELLGFFDSDLQEVRPVTKVRRLRNDGRFVEYEGWRSESIAECLDTCVVASGSTWLQKVEYIDARGSLILGYKQKNGSHLAWRQKNLEAAKANSRLQAAKSRARAREEWNQYCLAYSEKFPDSSPVGFDRWNRLFRHKWLSDGVNGLQPNVLMRAAPVVVV